MARTKVVAQRIRRPRPKQAAGKAPAREVKPVGVDRSKAFQNAINELRDHADQYMKEPDLGSVIRKLLGKVGVPLTDAQANSVCGAAGVDGSIRPNDADSLRSAVGRASKNLPKDGPTLDDLMKQMKPR